MNRRTAGSPHARTAVVSLCLGLCCVVSLPAIAQRVAVSPNVRMSTAANNEAWLAVSLADPNFLLAVAQNGEATAGSRDVTTLLSHDGGRQWKPVNLPGYTQGAFDPMVVAGADGRLYLLQGIIGGNFGAQIGADARVTPTIRVWSTTDGFSWEGPTNLKAPVPPDHPRMVVDQSRGKYRGRLYIAWNDVADQFLKDRYEVFLHYSDDHGKTFAEPIRIDEREGGKLVATEPVVLSDGTLLVTYYQYWNPLADPRNDRLPFFIRRSSDGGATFLPPEKIFDFGPHVWRERMGEFNRAFSLPVVMSDTSSRSPHRDNIYVVWDDVSSGKSDIWLARSADKGRTWSKPVRVNDNLSNSPLGVADFRMTPTVAVAPDGTVGITWYDRRNDPTRRCWQVFFATSTNGGAAFGTNLPISTAPSCPPPGQGPNVLVHNRAPYTDLNRAPDSLTARLALTGRLASLAQDAVRAARAEANRGLENNRFTVTFDPSRNGWPGHYSGLVADRDGVFHALWLDRRGGTQQMYTARITLGGSLPDRTGLVQEDITERVEVVAGAPVYDAAKATVRVPIQVRNVSNAPVYGPIMLRIVGAGVGVLAGDSVSAEIRLPGLGTDNMLPPLETSEPVIITVKAVEATGLDASFDFRIVGMVRRK